MIFANGTSGTIGKHLGAAVVGLTSDLVDFGQEKELLAYPLEDWKLIHLAGVVGAVTVDSDLSHSRRINIDATTSIGKFALAHGVQKFVYVSSSHVYAKSDEDLMESSLLDPISNYAQQKLKAECLLQEIFQDEPDRLCIVRVFSILGWGMPGFTLGGAIERVINNPSDEILRESLSERDFMTPYSIAQTLLRIANEDRADGIINLCTNKGTRVMDAAIRMARLKGIELAPHNFEMAQSANPRIVGDNTKLISLFPDLNLGWNPTLST